jgi:hypothetical protein
MKTDSQSADDTARELQSYDEMTHEQRASFHAVREDLQRTFRRLKEIREYASSPDICSLPKGN